MCRIIKCHLCDYDLRGLSAEARCPECGTPVETTLEARRTLGVCMSPERFRAIKKGLFLVAVAIGIEFLAFTASVLVAECFQRRLGLPVFLLGSLGGVALAFVGTMKCAVGCYSRFVMGFVLVLVVATGIMKYAGLFPSALGYVALVLSAAIALGLGLLLRGLSRIPAKAMDPKFKKDMGQVWAKFLIVTAPFCVSFLTTDWPTVPIAEGAMWMSNLIILLWALRLSLRFLSRFRQWIPEGPARPA